jgi:hypothetical protein
MCPFVMMHKTTLLLKPQPTNMYSARTKHDMNFRCLFDITLLFLAFIVTFYLAADFNTYSII